MVAPGVDADKEAGMLLDNLPGLWEEANLTERRKLLLAMLEAVYVDIVEEKAIVAILPKPTFRPLFEIANTREGSDVILINEPPPAPNEPEAADSCFWWRRGRVDCSLFANTLSSSIAWPALSSQVDLVYGGGWGRVDLHLKNGLAVLVAVDWQGRSLRKRAPISRACILF